MSKICFRCKIEKNLVNFYFSKKGRYYSYCKSCCAIPRKQKYIDTRPTSDNKFCNNCNTTKDIDQFYFDKNRNNYKSTCKECKKIYAKNSRKRINEYVKKYKNNNPNIRIKASIGSRLSSFVKSQKKSYTLLKCIGCSYDYLLTWIEFQLYGGMTFDNYGTVWHIDHCNPCNNYNLSDEEELLKCFNWKNLRPLYQEKNLIKGSKIFVNEILLQELKATVYEKNHSLKIQT
jgi:hypothetical protein